MKKKTNNAILDVEEEHSHMGRTGYGEQLLHMQHSSSQGRQTPTVLPPTLNICQVLNGCSMLSIHICMACECACQQHVPVGRTTPKGSKTRGQTQFSSISTTASDNVSPPCTRSQTAVKSRVIRSMIGQQSGNLNTSKHLNKISQHKVTDIDSTVVNERTHASNIACEAESLWQRACNKKEQRACNKKEKRPLWFIREATCTWRKSTTLKDFFDNFGREFSLPTNWLGKLVSSWTHFCKKKNHWPYKLLKSQTFRPIFQISPPTSKRVLQSYSRWLFSAFFDHIDQTIGQRLAFDFFLSSSITSTDKKCSPTKKKEKNAMQALFPPQWRVPRPTWVLSKWITKIAGRPMPLIGRSPLSKPKENRRVTVKLDRERAIFSVPLMVQDSTLTNVQTPIFRTITHKQTWQNMINDANCMRNSSHQV